MITCLGTATLDIILRCKEIKPGSKIDVIETFFSLGGGALNAATTFKNLNLQYQTYFRLGNDLIAKIILQKIKKEKLKSKIFYHQGPSQFSIVVLTPQKERTIFVYRGVSDHFSLDELYQIKQSNKFYYLTTANTKPQIFYRFLLKIKPQAKLIALNPSKSFLEDKNSPEALSLADILFFNHEEASLFLKKKADSLVLGKEIFAKLKPKILVLTLGEKGSITFFENKIFQAGIFRPKKVIDSTGAGDAFASAFFANLVLNKNLNNEVVRKSIIWGSANASANLEKLGAQIGLLKKKDYLKYEKAQKIII